MQTQSPDNTNRQTQSDPVSSTSSSVSPQPWVKPTFEQVPLNDALSGGASFNDGGVTYSS